MLYSSDENIDTLNKMMGLALIANRGKSAVGNEKSETVFDALDLNKDGTLSLTELTGVLGESNAKEFLTCLDTIEKVRCWRSALSWSLRDQFGCFFFVRSAGRSNHN